MGGNAFEAGVWRIYWLGSKARGEPWQHVLQKPVSRACHLSEPNMEI
jgi:hypothetical protein